MDQRTQKALITCAIIVAFITLAGQSSFVAAIFWLAFFGFCGWCLFQIIKASIR